MSATKEFKAPVTKRKQKEEEDFPRGGASGLTPLEYKEIAHQADTSLFSVSAISAFNYYFSVTDWSVALSFCYFFFQN